jgi:hypothetical protein
LDDDRVLAGIPNPMEMTFVRLMLFVKLMIVSLCASLLSFGLMQLGLMDALRIMAIGTVLSIAITVLYPDIRGIKNGDVVSVVNDSSLPSLIGRAGVASSDGRKNDKIRIVLHSGHEVMGVIESYEGIISPPRIKVVYEERLVE